MPTLSRLRKKALTVNLKPQTDGLTIVFVKVPYLLGSVGELMGLGLKVEAEAFEHSDSLQGCLQGLYEGFVEFYAGFF